jgi:hypothetical protein
VPVIVGAQTGNAGSSGVALIAEDGNVLPGTPKVQSATFLAAGKAYDVMMNAPASGALALPVFDRQLSLSTNNQRDGGMQAYIAVNGGALPQASSSTNAVANPDTYFLVPGNPVIVADPAKGVIANDVGVYGVTVQQGPSGGTLTLNPDGTFTYSPASGTTTDSFIYQANGNPAIKAKVTLAACTSNSKCLGKAPVAVDDAFSSSTASRYQSGAPGVLANDTDPSGLLLTAAISGAVHGGTVTLNQDGSFTAVPRRRRRATVRQRSVLTTRP